MNLINIIENIQEKIPSEEEIKNNSLYEKCLNLKSPMDFTNKVGTIEDITELIEFLKNEMHELGRYGDIIKSLVRLKPEKSTKISFV